MVKNICPKCDTRQTSMVRKALMQINQKNMSQGDKWADTVAQEEMELKKKK